MIPESKDVLRKENHTYGGMLQCKSVAKHLPSRKLAYYDKIVYTNFYKQKKEGSDDKADDRRKSKHGSGNYT